VSDKTKIDDDIDEVIIKLSQLFDNNGITRPMAMGAMQILYLKILESDVNSVAEKGNKASIEGFIGHLGEGIKICNYGFSMLQEQLREKAKTL